MIATSTPRPPVSSSTASTGSRLAARDRGVGVHDGRGHVEALAVQLDEEHPRRAARPSQPDVQAADRPGADDHDVVARADAGELLGIDGAGERLGDRCLVEADAVRDPVEAVDPQDLVGDDEVLREAALVLVADRGLVRADRHPATEAVGTGPIGNRRDDLDAIADGPGPAVRRRAHVGPDLDDLAGDLVPHDPRRVDVLMAGAVDLDVRAAGRAVANPDLDLGRAG